METQGHDGRPDKERFRILVSGRLDQRFMDSYEGIELGTWSGGSTLEGVFKDQSHLRGILDRLWRLGIEVHRFETLSDQPPPRSPTSESEAST